MISRSLDEVILKSLLYHFKNEVTFKSVSKIGTGRGGANFYKSDLARITCPDVVNPNE